MNGAVDDELWPPGPDELAEPVPGPGWARVASAALLVIVGGAAVTVLAGTALGFGVLAGDLGLLALGLRGARSCVS